MASEEIKRNRILDFAFKKFTTEGINQVTMDDVARGVGMGKGTLYKYFPSKEVLLMNTIDFFASHIEKSLEKVIADNKLTPVEKLTLFLKAITEKLSKVNPSTLTYLQRSMPEVYEKIERTRERVIMKNLTALFEEGKNNGIFDPKMDNYLVAHIFIGAITHLLATPILTNMNYTLDQLFHSIISTIFQGCMTEEGRKLCYPQSN